MKNLFLYYLLILLPIPLLVVLLLEDTMTFFIGLLVYFFYRGIVDGFRLYKLGKIAKKDIWKTNIAFYQFKYFETLYFKKS